MWQNDSFAGNGVGNFLASNGNQNNLSSPFTASSLSGSQFTQHSYQPSVNENLHMTGTKYQPEPGSYSSNNTDAFGRNTSQYHADIQYSAPTTPSTSGPTTSLPDLNSRAAELKAKLIQNKIRQGSTPPIHIGKSAVNSLSNIPSPSTPAADIGASVTDLIKEFSGSAEQITHAQSQNNNGIQAISKAVDKAAKSHTTSLGSPAKVSKPEGNNGMQTGRIVARKRTSNGSLSEASEGEIIEDDLPEKQTKPTLAQSIRDQPPKNSKNEEPAQIEVRTVYPLNNHPLITVGQKIHLNKDLQMTFDLYLDMFAQMNLKIMLMILQIDDPACQRFVRMTYPKILIKQTV
ncbi:hypothetical protein B0O99DRAFT_589959 [Bisporella sp. PMI_857]|nr:hypothetical protein B0O99DRAFT_669045 [Bisporella sp. PMI_857]KAH8600278.1 hypothetical protein B0O99DRAFT_589959 [Bisporella sp. PMI_857]